jgi:urease accessory protein
MLQVFKALPVAHGTRREAELAAGVRSYQRDLLTLGWEERLKVRARRRSDDGFDFATALPRGTVLREGDAFVFDAERRLVVVAETAEAVFVVQPKTPAEWALFAYHLGNSHQPLMIDAGSLVCPDVPGMLQVLEYHRIPFVRATRAFTPVLAQNADHRHAR